MGNANKSHAIVSRPWREPYDVLLAFAVADGDDVERLHPRVSWACRELKKRAWYLKRDPLEPVPEKDSILRDQELGSAVEALIHALRRNPTVDDATRQRIGDVCQRIFSYRAFLP